MKKNWFAVVSTEYTDLDRGSEDFDEAVEIARSLDEEENIEILECFEDTDDIVDSWSVDAEGYVYRTWC